jgi:hypothetical protein
MSKALFRALDEALASLGTDGPSRHSVGTSAPVVPMANPLADKSSRQSGHSRHQGDDNPAALIDRGTPPPELDAEVGARIDPSLQVPRVPRVPSEEKNPCECSSLAVSTSTSAVPTRCPEDAPSGPAASANGPVQKLHPLHGGPVGESAAAWGDWMRRRAGEHMLFGRQRGDALSATWGEAELVWHAWHGVVPDRYHCAGCQAPLLGRALLTLSDGARVHWDDGHGHDCLVAYGRRWRGCAAAGLAELGLTAPGTDRKPLPPPTTISAECPAHHEYRRHAIREPLTLRESRMRTRRGRPSFSLTVACISSGQSGLHGSTGAWAVECAEQ